MDRSIQSHKKGQGLESISIGTEIFTLALGETTLSSMAPTSLKMESALKAMLKTVSKERANTTTPMAISMKEAGKMISSMALAKCSIQMEIVMTDRGKRARKMAKELISIAMEPFIMANS